MSDDTNINNENQKKQDYNSFDNNEKQMDSRFHFQNVIYFERVLQQETEQQDQQTEQQEQQTKQREPNHQLQERTLLKPTDLNTKRKKPMIKNIQKISQSVKIVDSDITKNEITYVSTLQKLPLKRKLPPANATEFNRYVTNNFQNLEQATGSNAKNNITNGKYFIEFFDLLQYASKFV